MKIIVNSPLMGDKIIEALTSYNQDNVKYDFIAKSGIKLEFEVSGAEEATAAELTKRIIRSHDFGNALYFQVLVM